MIYLWDEKSDISSTGFFTDMFAGMLWAFALCRAPRCVLYLHYLTLSYFQVEAEREKEACPETNASGRRTAGPCRPTTLHHLRVQWGVRGNGQAELLQRSCAKAITDSQSRYSINNRKWWPINCRCLNTVSHIGNLCPYFSYPQTSLKALKIEILKIFDWPVFCFC